MPKQESFIIPNDLDGNGAAWVLATSLVEASYRLRGIEAGADTERCIAVASEAGRALAAANVELCPWGPEDEVNPNDFEDTDFIDDAELVPPQPMPDALFYQTVKAAELLQPEVITRSFDLFAPKAS